MTIAISIKIHDGIVLASDSASTVVNDAGSVLNIYNNANKIFNLKKGLPIGAIVWGLGNIGNASLETISKDFRKKHGQDIKNGKYQIKQVADDYSKYVKKIYDGTFGTTPNEQKPQLGFAVVGYSAEKDMAEEYLVRIVKGQQAGPAPVRAPTETGMWWQGETEPLSRLLLGISNTLPGILKKELEVTDIQIAAVMEAIKNESEISLIHPSMPIQDAIKLAEFLVDFAIRFSHFKLGAPTVGGPIEIAAITRHEGFKWVQRKHYFGENLNPRT